METIPKALFKKIRRLEIETAKLAEEMMVGLYHSVFKGQGMEFEEVRGFVDGDDLRSIDWNVTARMGTPYIKRFREERELTVFLLVDLSASTCYGGSGGKLKREAIAEIAALLAFTAIKNNDKVGLLLFTDKVEKLLPPKKGWRHVLRILRELLAYEPQSSGTDIGAALDLLGHLQRRSAVVFLLSDFLAPLPLKQLATSARRHDLIALRISDAAEETLPDIGLAAAIDPESGKEQIVDFSDKALRKRHRLLAEERQRRFKETLRRAGASLLTLPSDGSYIVPLRQFFQRRRIRH